MIERDRRDTTRADSPLKIAKDAIVIDSTGKSIEQTFEEMLSVIKDNIQPAFERCDGKSATD
jgi:Cytidylate kinase